MTNYKGPFEYSGLDRYDQAILEVLSVDGRCSISAMAKKISLSKTPTQTRLHRLESAGYIKGYRASLDPIKLGLSHVAFVEVKLSDTREEALKAFNEAAAKIAEIEQLHLIAGNFDYLMKVRTRDMNAYRLVLAEKISTLPFIASTSTFVAMQSIGETIP